MQEKNQDMLLLDGAFEADRQSASICGGTCVAYTCRSPDKETENEDTLAVIPFGTASAVFVVADGAGGLPAGKRASLTAVKVLAASLGTALEQEMLLRTAVLNGIEAANDAVRELSNGSATTLTVVTLEDRTVRAYQIGDSGAFVIGQRGLVKLQTTAHSPTGFAVEAGFLDQREALHHEERHLVSNFIGTVDMSIDIGATVDMAARDTLVLASDGLTDNLHVEEIVDAVRKGPIDAACDRLVELARGRMLNTTNSQPSKPDDLTLVVFRKPPVRRTS